MDEAKPAKEARAHPRAPIELKVEYKKMNTFFSDYTKNISKGGTFIKTDRPLPMGTEFLFKLFVPALGEPFTLRGRVAWLNSDTVTQRPDVTDKGMGIQFQFSDPSQRTAFEGVVENLMKDALGDVVYRKLLDKAK